jgi:hypothetical protein
MPIYYQKISDTNFKANADFLVKDSKGCNFTLGFLSLALFVTIVLVDRFDTRHPSVFQFFYLAFIPAILLIKRGMANKTIMVINKNGFYYLGELITNWDNFINAVVSQDHRSAVYYLHDDFVLLIRYYKPGQPGYYGRKISLDSRLDKAEEEIMAAIKFYYQHSKSPANSEPSRTS